MFSRPVGVVLLALGSLTAAAGGAYVATRHNAADATVAAPVTGAGPVTAAAPAQPAPLAPQAVAETEAAITAKAEEKKTEEKKAPVMTSRSVAQKSAPAASKGNPPRPETATRTAPPAPAPAAPPPPDQQPAQAVSFPGPASTPKPAVEPSKPVETVPQPEPPRAPQFEEVIVPSAAVLGLQVETSTSTERARIEDRIDARVSRDVMAAGRVAIPAGSRVIGSVTTVERGGKVKEQARLGIRFHTLVLADGTQVPLNTEPVMRLGEAVAGSSAKKIGGAAVGGAILGAILGGGKGAAIGSATGAAGGTAAVMAGDRSAATLRQGEYLNVKLAAPATITVERRE
jgi:hypothetical protein